MILTNTAHGKYWCLAPKKPQIPVLTTHSMHLDPETLRTPILFIQQPQILWPEPQAFRV